jgi:flagellar assembly factor FliW
MIIESSRFGALELPASDVFTLHNGLPGHRTCRHFAWIPDSADQSRAWLQSANEPALAVRLIAPQALVPGYCIDIQEEILPILSADDPREIRAYVPLENNGHGLAAQFDHPILVHPATRCGLSVSLPGMPEIRNFLPPCAEPVMDAMRLWPRPWQYSGDETHESQSTGIPVKRAV